MDINIGIPTVYSPALANANETLVTPHENWEQGPLALRRTQANPEDVARFEKHYAPTASGSAPAIPPGAATTDLLRKPAESANSPATLEQAAEPEPQDKTEEEPKKVSKNRTEEEPNPYKQEPSPHSHSQVETSHLHKDQTPEWVHHPVTNETIEYVNQGQLHAYQHEARQVIENPAEFLNEVADKLLSRLLVSDPGKDDKREVRLVFNDDALAGVELQLERVRGALEVRLSVGDPDRRVAFEGHKDSLQQYLREKLGEEVNVILH